MAVQSSIRELTASLRGRLPMLTSAKAGWPGDRFRKSGASVPWIKPKLVAQLGFFEWTRDGKLRHPQFLGLRSDKPPQDVVREKKGV